jgi:tetratricopeptide (TPR) repeat protein
MSGRRLFWVVAPLLLLAVWGHGREAWRRLVASHQLAAVEGTVLGLSRQGLLTHRPPRDPRVRQLLERSVVLLRRAEELDPVAVGIPVARGSLYSLLGRPEAAVRAYGEALELERRPEIYANVGRAHLREDDREAAQEAFRRAVRLDRTLTAELRGYLPELYYRRGRDRAAAGKIFADDFESGGLERWAEQVTEREEEEDE